jgi:hypothetical protein
MMMQGNPNLVGRHVSKEKSSSARTHRPAGDVVGVRPDEVTVRALVRNLLKPLDDLDLIDCAKDR